MNDLSLIKFSSEDCGTCHRMSHYDQTVANQLGLDFLNVLLQDTTAYRKYRHILLTQYPNKEGMGWPTYLIVKDPDAEFSILGEIKGGMAKGEFRKKLEAIIS